jgi:hypothetical protein
LILPSKFYAESLLLSPNNPNIETRCNAHCLQKKLQTDLCKFY